MRSFKTLYATLFLLSFLLYKEPIQSVITNVVTQMDVNGNVVSAWQDDFNTGSYNIVAAVLPAGGTWSTPITISTGAGLNTANPKIAINALGNAVVIWSGYNPAVGYTSLYGSTLTSLSFWSTPVQISDSSEHVYDNYSVNLSDNNDFVTVWNAFSFVTYTTTVRSVAGPLGTWSTPVTVSP